MAGDVSPVAMFTLCSNRESEYQMCAMFNINKAKYHGSPCAEYEIEKIGIDFKLVFPER